MDNTDNIYYEKNFPLLKKNLIDVIKESQIKIGFTKNDVALYYPLNALNNILESNFSKEEMMEVLNKFTSYAADELGKINFSFGDERFCIKIPAEGVEYVHTKIETPMHLKEFIDYISQHKGTIEGIVDIFKKYSDNVVCKEYPDNDEFNYLVYFGNGSPDDYRYCINIEFGHITYHRFTPNDFDELKI